MPDSPVCSEPPFLGGDPCPDVTLSLLTLPQKPMHCADVSARPHRAPIADRRKRPSAGRRVVGTFFKSFIIVGLPMRARAGNRNACHLKFESADSISAIELLERRINTLLCSQPGPASGRSTSVGSQGLMFGMSLGPRPSYPVGLFLRARRADANTCEAGTA
jgi:hypothetical protein